MQGVGVGQALEPPMVKGGSCLKCGHRGPGQRPRAKSHLCLHGWNQTRLCYQLAACPEASH